MRIQELLGVKVAAATMNEALSMVDDAIAARRRLQIGVVNAAKIVNMRRNDALRQDVLGSTVVFADGTAIVWASRMLGRGLPERVAGIDLMTGMLERGHERGYRFYCLGATPDILQRTVDRIRREYPGAVVAGMHHGYFSSNEEEEVAADIARSAPDVLLVAMTSPRKEQFLSNWSPRLEVPVCHGVGGSFDVMAGFVQRAPERWQRLGLEWLYRVKQEPRRLWKRYLVTNSIFIWMVLTAFARQQVARVRPSARPVNT